MLTEQQLNGLIGLLRQRYADWEDFAHPGFVADEIAYKRATAVKAATWLSQTELDRLLAAADFDECLTRLERLAHDNNLLWRRVPGAGDTAVLQHPRLDKAEFCPQVRNLLYDHRPGAERLQTFAAYLTAMGLPNGWPLPTYLLFMVHPEADILVKPQAAQWFLRYMGGAGANVTITAPPTLAVYRLIQEQAKQLQHALASYGAVDLIDVQSFLWVCYQQARRQTGGLDVKAQVELDVPYTGPAEMVLPEGETAVLREPPSAYQPIPPTSAPVSLAHLAISTGYAASDLTRWVRAIRRKGQGVFYGPPGTGKTFLAHKLAAHLVGDGDGLVELVQFHPAYAYEDFMQGIRPVMVGGEVRYEMRDGRFLDFCRRAATCAGPSVFIIDEMNRANIASVFGELMYLLEYRERDIPLAGGGRFHIPDRVFILGTMNTADRSIALIDHALRRRFAFIHLHPDEAILRHYHASTGIDISRLTAVWQALNRHIGDPDYHVGHTYFLHPHLAQHLEEIWRLEIEPYLEEQFYGQRERVEEFRWQHIRSQLAPP